MTRAVALVVLVMAAVACGGPEAPAVEYPPLYTIDGGTLFCDAPDTRSSTPAPNRTSTCTWYCAGYKGQEQRYVTLVFAYTGSTWRLASEYVSAGLC